jgi:hypothetical protein
MVDDSARIIAVTYSYIPDAHDRMTIFQVFGSASSLDLDVLVFVETLPELELSKSIALKLAPIVRSYFVDVKPANINFGVIRDGVIVETLKGSPDETNNAVLATYHLHHQPYPLKIERPVPRNLGAKYDRTMRIILSLYSRTQHRPAIKQALRGDFSGRCELLKRLNLSLPVDFGKHLTSADVYKSIAFQLGQALALTAGVELYTKEDLIAYFPAFSAALRREPPTFSCLQALEVAKQRFVAACAAIESDKLNSPAEQE